MEKRSFIVLEVASVVFGVMACYFLIHLAVVGFPQTGQPFMLIDLDIRRYAEVFEALIMFVFSKTASIYAAHQAKLLGPEEYERLNNATHKWVVLGISACMFVCLGITAITLRDWYAVGHLIGAVVLYVVFSKVIKVRSHSFGARARSVVLVQLAIGMGILLLLPRSNLGYALITITGIVGGIAIGNLWGDKKKYGWSLR